MRYPRWRPMKSQIMNFRGWAEFIPIAHPIRHFGGQVGKYYTLEVKGFGFTEGGGVLQFHIYDTQDSDSLRYHWVKKPGRDPSKPPKFQENR